MKRFLPKPDVLITLQPEEIGLHLLAYFVSIEDEGRGINLFNTFYHDGSTLKDYLGGYPQNLLASKILSEAAQWLKEVGCLADLPTNSANWVFVTRKGRSIKSNKDFKKMTSLRLIPFDQIDEKLKSKVVSSFIRGDFETCVFAAYKEVEIRLREACRLDKTWYGVRLADKAFNIKDGLLTDPELTDLEKIRFHEMIKGTIGTFKNPSSHRDVNYDDPVIAAGLILFANSLLKTIDVRASIYHLECLRAEQALRPG